MLRQIYLRSCWLLVIKVSFAWHKNKESEYLLIPAYFKTTGAWRKHSFVNLTCTLASVELLKSLNFDPALFIYLVSIFICTDLCALAEAVLLELPGLGGHCLVHLYCADHGCGLPGILLCGSTQAPSAAYHAAKPDPGPCRLP